MDRKQTNYNKLVARQGDEFIFCDYIFIDGPIFGDGVPFQGATGTRLRPISKDEYEERTSEQGLMDNLGDLWQATVASGGTEMGKQEWVNDVYDTDGDEALFDFSGGNLWEQLREIGYSEEEYPVIECTGGGRCFSVEDKYDEVFDQELLDKIREIETKPVKAEETDGERTIDVTEPA